MQEMVINKTELAMRLGLILAFSYVMRGVVSMIAVDGILMFVVKFMAFFFEILPFVFLFRMTVNYCIFFNDCKYQFFTPFSIAIKGFAFAGIVYTLFIYIVLKYYEPNLLSDFLNSYTKVIEEQGDEQFLAQWKEVSVMTTPKTMIPLMYISFMMMGLFVSFISVVCARFAKMRKPVDNNLTSDNNDSDYNKDESK